MSNLKSETPIFQNYPSSGPLAKYRKNSSFDWKKLRLMVDDEKCWKLRYKIWNFMENHPLFDLSYQNLPLDQVRQLSSKRAYVVYNERFFNIEEYLERPDLAPKFGACLSLVDSGCAAKVSLGFGTFSTVIQSLNSNGLLNNYVEENQKMNILGAFCLTEIGHGSNTKGMLTTATYCKESGNFILNSPSFEAAKAWCGNLGKTCTHGIVYAQLMVDGVKYGLNAFVVPLRCTKTLKPFPGVIVGDLGEKIGMNGVDNGFVMFNNYHIPRENFLSRVAEVSEDGKYISKVKEGKTRFASFGALSETRVGICDVAGAFMTRAITIAIRYSAARKQFGPENSDEEFPIIEYQAQQYRLFPHLAATFAVRIFGNWLTKHQGEISIKTIMGEKIGNVGAEMHGLSSAAKSVCTWASRDLIQECREACGGHGYLRAAGIGDLRNDVDPSCTYEGENNVLLQQAANWLVSIRSKGYDKFAENSPMGTVTFLENFKAIIQSKFRWTTTREALEPRNLLMTFDWIVSYLLEKVAGKVDDLKRKGYSAFDTRNNSQVFYARDLSLAYAQRTIFFTFFVANENLENGPEKDVLMRLLSLYGANLITKNYMGILYEGGFVQNGNAAKLYQNGILEVLAILKDDAVSLIDAITFPDYVINSCLGKSDGEIYKNLQASILNSPKVFERPEWWQDITHKESYIVPKYKM